MILTTLSLATPDVAYSQSVAAVRTFASWIESQSAAPNPSDALYTQALNSLAQLKQDTMRWINEVYPACLTIPQQVSAAGSQITPSLATLTTLAQQLAQQPGNQNVQAAIVQTSGTLSATISPLQQQIQGLVQALGSAGSILQAELPQAHTSEGGLIQDVNGLQVRLSTLYGQMHSLTHQTCPSQRDIDACNAAIQTTQQQLGSTTQLYMVLQQALTGSSTTLQGLSYMGSFWSQVAANASAVSSALVRIASDPVAVLQLDLQTAAQSWATLEAQVQQTVEQLAAVPQS